MQRRMPWIGCGRRMCMHGAPRPEVVTVKRTRSRLHEQGIAGLPRPTPSLLFFPISPTSGLVAVFGDSIPDGDQFRRLPRSTTLAVGSLTTEVQWPAATPSKTSGQPDHCQKTFFFPWQWWQWTTAGLHRESILAVTRAYGR